MSANRSGIGILHKRYTNSRGHQTDERFKVNASSALIDLRHIYNMTQKELAELCGVKQNAISRAETEGCTLRTLICVADVLGYNLKISILRNRVEIKTYKRTPHGR